MAEKRGPPASSTSDEDGNDTGTAIILKRQKIAADAVILGSITKEVGASSPDIMMLSIPQASLNVNYSHTELRVCTN